MSTSPEKGPLDARSRTSEAQRAFMQVVMSAEHELLRATQRLRDSLGSLAEGEARHIAQRFVERAREQRDELERRIEAEVLAALGRVRAPIDRELEAIRGRMERLGDKLERLRGRPR